MTISGLLPPIVDGDDDLLVDGGYSNNLPIDIMHQMPHRPKTLISVDVENRDASMFNNLYDYGNSVEVINLVAKFYTGPGISGFKIVWATLISHWFKKRIPAFSDIILFLNCISHMRQLRTFDEDLVSLYINPPITHYGILDYPKMDEIVEKAYIYAKQTVEAWLKEHPDEFCPKKGSRQRLVTAMANARSRASLHLKSLRSEASIPHFHSNE